MDTTRSILIYNLYPLNSWQEITAKIFAAAPHNEIVVHINVPKRNPWKAILAYRYLSSFNKVKKIYFSLNLKLNGESTGFNKIRSRYDFSKYNIATYTHSKGSSRKRKNTQPIRDWTEYLRYFVVERLDLTIKAFSNGYSLSGVNLMEGQLRNADNLVLVTAIDSKFYYEGNFVTINLDVLREEFISKPCQGGYFAVEAFWGTLCHFDNAFSLHQSNVDHYQQPYQPSEYREV